MKNERSCRFKTKHLAVFGFVSGMLLTVQLATMALAIKERKLAALREHVAIVEEQNRQFLSSLLAGANGGGYSIEMNSRNSVFVACKIDFEWVNGVMYEGNAGRRIPKTSTIAKR